MKFITREEVDKGDLTHQHVFDLLDALRDRDAEIARLTVALNGACGDSARLRSEAAERHGELMKAWDDLKKERTEVARLTVERDELLLELTILNEAGLMQDAERDAALAQLAEANARAAKAERTLSGLSDIRSTLREVINERDSVTGALEALVAGVEDSVLRFLASHDVSLRSDMEAVLLARMARARETLDALKAEGAGT